MPYALEGTKLSLGGGALTVDLQGYIRDYPVQLDISADEAGALVVGLGHRYIAQIDIPARSYVIVAGASDDFGFPRLRKAARPLDTGLVKLTLWALEV